MYTHYMCICRHCTDTSMTDRKPKLAAKGSNPRPCDTTAQVYTAPCQVSLNTGSSQTGPTTWWFCSTVMLASVCNPQLCVTTTMANTYPPQRLTAPRWVAAVHPPAAFNHRQLQARCGLHSASLKRGQPIQPCQLSQRLTGWGQPLQVKGEGGAAVAVQVTAHSHQCIRLQHTAHSGITMEDDTQCQWACE
jgi:hypothetical protein